MSFLDLFKHLCQKIQICTIFVKILCLFQLIHRKIQLIDKVFPENNGNCRSFSIIVRKRIDRTLIGAGLQKFLTKNLFDS